jgi:hypothetical protein
LENVKEKRINEGKRKENWKEKDKINANRGKIKATRVCKE